MFELVAGPGGSLEFPVPWADQEDQSWLVTAEELRELLDSEPLTVVAWRSAMAALAHNVADHKIALVQAVARRASA